AETAAARAKQETLKFAAKEAWERAEGRKKAEQEALERKKKEEAESIGVSREPQVAGFLPIAGRPPASVPRGTDGRRA
ncbi:MAG: hypothetical protein ACE5F1_19025, partial [Planctomycetota bacterium]